MLYTHVVALATIALCVAEDGTKRAARNPGLLHLAHAGHSVGSYVAPEGDHGGARGVGGGAGPQILIYGGRPAQVTTRVVSKDSLEELDEDIRQHYQQQQQQGTPVRYVPNSSFRGHYFDHGRPNLDFSGFKDAPVSSQQYTPGHDYPGPTGAPPAALGYPRTYGHFGVGQLLYSPHAAHTPLGHGFTFVGHPAHQSQTPQHTPTSAPSHYPLTGHTATPATANYATPTTYPSSYPVTPTASPLSHTLSSPYHIPGRVTLHRPLQGGAAPIGPLVHQGLRYSTPLSHGPVFVPVQAFSQQPHGYFQNPGLLQYSPHPGGFGRSQPHKDEQGDEDEDRQSYFEDAQERRPSEYQGSHQREYEDEESPAYSRENTNYQKSYEEGLPKSAATPAFQTYPSDDKGSLEDSSNEAGSGEKGPNLKYSFPDDHAKGRSSPLGEGEGKVATSYQSVTFETHHAVPRHYPKQKLN